jgi:hypothetical protein
VNKEDLGKLEQRIVNMDLFERARIRVATSKVIVCLPGENRGMLLDHETILCVLAGEKLSKLLSNGGNVNGSKLSGVGMKRETES